MQVPSSRIPPILAAAVASDLYKPCAYLQAKYASGAGLCQFSGKPPFGDIIFIPAPPLRLEHISKRA